MAVHKNAGKTVAQILNDKRARIKNAPLDEGSPSWDDIRDLMWEEIVKRARKRVTGYGTIRKLLSDPRFDK